MIAIVISILERRRWRRWRRMMEGVVDILACELHDQRLDSVSNSKKHVYIGRILTKSCIHKTLQSRL